MKTHHSTIDGILNDLSGEASNKQTDDRLRRLWDHPPMQELLLDYADPFEVKIARSVLDAIKEEDLARYLARHIRQQPCEDRDMRIVGEHYIVSLYVQADQRRLMFHTDVAKRLTCVVMLPVSKPSPNES